MIFTYLPDVSSVPLSQVKAWQWDFDGTVTAPPANATQAQLQTWLANATWDVKKTVGVSGTTVADLNNAWTSVYSAARAVGGVCSFLPRLAIIKTDNTIFTNTTAGVTEDVFGYDSQIDPAILVRPANTEPDLDLSIAPSPRLARAALTNSSDPFRTKSVKIYAQASFRSGPEAGTISKYEWDLNYIGSNDGSNFNASPALTGAALTELTVPLNPSPLPADGVSFPAPASNSTYARTFALRVTYRLKGKTTDEVPVTMVLKDALVVQDVPAKLSMGRAYRQGFPERYGWEEIIKAYAAEDGLGNSYGYFNLFEEAFLDQQVKLATTSVPAERQTMAEIVNELLQGQSLRGFQTMINALRARYPRITDRAEPRLPAPAGAREETATLETAALDFQQPLQYAAYAIRAYGPAILRAGTPVGQTPFNPAFPQYVTFTDETLSGQKDRPTPIPVKNEYWQLSVAAGGQGQARVEKAKLLWRNSTQDATALPEAKEECKVAATQSYLAMALLAQGQTASEFSQNEGGNLEAHVRNATDLFDKINAGVNPSGTDGSFIPNESFAAIHQDAQDAADEAKIAEVTARDEKRSFDRNQADLRNELQAQRNQYITPLTLLTGLDPATYNNLQTDSDRRDYENVFTSRLNNLIQNYPAVSASGLGEYGAQVAAIKDTALSAQQALNRLHNLSAAIEIDKAANVQVDLANEQATRVLQASDIVRGFASAIEIEMGFSPKVTHSPGSVVSGFLNAADRQITMIQQAKIADINLGADIRKRLLEAANLSIDIQKAGIALDQGKLRLDTMRAQMKRYIEDLAHTRATAVDLYFLDPSFRVAASQAEQRAIAKLDYAVDKLYRLARTLQYEWTEAYQNPLIIPAASNEPPALENALFDKFTQQDSLFAVRSADEALDYLGALKDWDSKLRRINGASVRGPNHSAPISAVPISMREQILGYKPNAATGYTLDKSIAEFRNYLENHRVANFYNSSNPSLELHFPIGIEDNSYFPATGSRWNLRLNSISAEVYAESGLSDQQVLEIDLIQGGMVTLRRFFANPPASDDLLKMTHTVDNLNRTVFATAFPAKINGATAGRPLTEFDNLGLKGRPVAATDWILRINTENPANRNINFAKIKDIVLKFTYTNGNPEEFPNF